jgi:type I restriction enzyme M protein
MAGLLVKPPPLVLLRDAFGRMYEYFLVKFAMGEGQTGGEFFTPACIVKLIVEIIQPYKGKIHGSACGSGGMFVQSADFVTHHEGGALSVYAQERVEETVRHCKMNLAVHGLGGSVLQSNSCTRDPFEAVGNVVLIEDVSVTNFPPNTDFPGRPWLLLHGNRLYVAYDAVPLPENLSKIEVYVSVYELIQTP